MKKIRMSLMIIAVSCSVYGCSAFYGSDVIQNRDTDYLKARSIPPLKIPPDVSSAPFNESYPVYPQPYPESQKKISLKPPGL